ncbi:hypothetical protein Tco_0577550 [Tanacetum coccineum]
MINKRCGRSSRRLSSLTKILNREVMGGMDNGGVVMENGNGNGNGNSDGNGTGNWKQWRRQRVLPEKMMFQKMETELWNLSVKNNDMATYTQRFQELTMITHRLTKMLVRICQQLDESKVEGTRCEFLIVQGDKSDKEKKSTLSIISCEKAQKYMEKGCQLFLALGTVKKKTKTSQRRATQKTCDCTGLPDVFLKDLPGLPPIPTGFSAVWMQKEKVLALYIPHFKIHEKNYTNTLIWEIGELWCRSQDVGDIPFYRHEDALCCASLIMKSLQHYLDQKDVEARKEENYGTEDLCGMIKNLEPRADGNILAKIGMVAYRLELPKKLSRIYSTFHISNLKKCLSDKPLAIPLDEIHVDDKLNFIEEPVEVMDREVKRLKQIRIPIVKVYWNSRRGPEYTSELED